MLEATAPGFLRRDVYRHAQENNLPPEFLTPLKGSELLKREEFELYALPRTQKRILESEKTSHQSLQKAIQSVCNCNPYSTPEVEKIELTLGNIPNPYAISQVTPVHSSGEGPNAQWIQTWRNTGNPSQKCLRTHYSRKKKKLDNIT